MNPHLHSAAKNEIIRVEVEMRKFLKLVLFANLLSKSGD